MKLVVFDVWNAACSLAVCPNWNSMMIDCGSNSEKECPTQAIKRLQKFLSMKKHSNWTLQYDLTRLHITHPDDDHVRNAMNLLKEMPPAILHRRPVSMFPTEEQIHEEYKIHLDEKYTGPVVTYPDWWWEHTEFQIPIESILWDEELSKKIKNNSSMLKYIRYAGVRILFGGDMEWAWWNRLLDNDKVFVEIISQGIDIFIAPHHGHTSWFETRLFETMGKVKISILSKWSEANIEWTDVSTQYWSRSEWINYYNLNDKNTYFADGVLTTRSNGNIYFSVDPNWVISVFADNASSNHKKV